MVCCTNLAGEVMWLEGQQLAEVIESASAVLFK
jgi:hypothetical protein